MLSISIIGTGNVAQHLFDELMSYPKSIKVDQVIGRNLKSLSYFKDKVETSSDYNNISHSDICIIAINDDAISSVSQQLKINNCLIVHTSGSKAMTLLDKHKRIGVFYPLQTFSKNRKVSFKTIPICIESAQEADLFVLQKLGKIISNKVVTITSKERKSLHLAAVFVNNFTNHVNHIAHEVCLENKVSYKLLHPLLLETIHKLEELSPLDAQTGPAKRDDQRTIEAQKNMLTKASHKKIYHTLSQSIKETYGEEL